MEDALYDAFSALKDYVSCNDLPVVVRELGTAKRDEFDKLPRQFEFVAAFGSGIMSFRGWRDLQRQGFCTHLRTLVTPLIGFYRYDKPAPEELNRVFEEVHHENKKLYWDLIDVPDMPRECLQYPLAMGNLIGYQIAANLREWEFCTWQRTKFAVNHEVRRVFLAIEQALRRAYPWWENLSRADMTPAFILARTKNGISL